MIILEFLIFVISSGLFCSERFRHNLYAVLIAGGVATASSLLFVYHIGTTFMLHADASPPKIIKQIVRVPVVQKISQPPALSKAEDCHVDYPFWARLFGDEGTTDLAFRVLADGTVDGVSVAHSSGSERLDKAAVHCVARWHFRPGIKDGVLVDMPWTASVAWNLHDTNKSADAPAEKADKAVAPAH
ncbi:MAG: energy transducer TonB [Alphaproteobacteria bacterium]|nr:energy transducer TonB [Alphaproteobacteria bacterium]